MPALRNHQSNNITKLLLIGDSGSGKSGSLASLADDGYNLRILDLDNGIDVLKNLLLDEKSTYKKESADRVTFATITDQMKAGPNGRLIPSQAKVWQRTVEMLSKWKTPEEDLGPITSWGDKDVLVIDSLTMLSTAALNFVLAMNGRLGGRVEQSDWYSGQQMIEGLLQMLYDDSVKCNVIITSHITYIGEEGASQHGYPNTLGKALPPKVGRYFNSILMTRTTGMGTARKQQIFTVSQGVIELKNTAPLRVPASYPIGTGLAEYFRHVRAGGEPAKVALAPKPGISAGQAAQVQASTLKPNPGTVQ